MLDFNDKPNLSEQICACIDSALQSAQDHYLSRLRLTSFMMRDLICTPKLSLAGNTAFLLWVAVCGVTSMYFGCRTRRYFRAVSGTLGMQISER